MSFGNPAANSWRQGFLPHVETELHRTDHQGSRDLLERIHVAAQALFDVRRPSLPDIQDRAIVEMCSLILLDSRELRAAFELVKTTLHLHYKTVGEWMNRSLLWF